MDIKINVVYTIGKREGWRNDGIGVCIKSNIANDELVECDISKSLVEHLRKESAMLDPEKLLLGFAEAQRRGIEDHLQSIDDMALRAENSAKKIHESLFRSYEDLEGKYAELDKKFSDTQSRFRDKINSTMEQLVSDAEKVKAIADRLQAVDNYNLKNLTDTLEQIIALVEKDKELVSLVLKERTKNSNN